MARVSGRTDKDQQLKLLGQAIRARRELLKVSQESLADEAQMDRAHMGKIERGERNVSLDNIYRLAEAVEADISSLFLSLIHI